MKSHLEYMWVTGQAIAYSHGVWRPWRNATISTDRSKILESWEKPIYVYRGLFVSLAPDLTQPFLFRWPDPFDQAVMVSRWASRLRPPPKSIRVLVDSRLASTGHPGTSPSRA